jgi:hypothetical protein
MINRTYPEIAEISNDALPPASLEALQTLRNNACEGSHGGFKLQSQQRFLRRILSPDSPVRNVLIVHGTGSGKTCSAIQVAEEYILRPEFQDKKVMVVSSRAVEENFRTQIFEINRVNIDVASGTLESKQCTGRRYLDMLLRIESEPKNWNNPTIRDKLERTADKLIDEFYEFKAYESFGNLINNKIGPLKKNIDEKWVHDTFDNRLLIIDEAHNIRESKLEGVTKGVTEGLEKLVKIANGLVLVFLTATPMFDTFEEIVFYMNLFLWNDRVQDFDKPLKAENIFDENAELKDPETFRDWCSKYVSYVKGENPFTFPFRLPPPSIAPREAVKTSFLRKTIMETDRIQYIPLVESIATGLQLKVLSKEKGGDKEEKRQSLMQNTVSVLPENKTFREVFSMAGDQYAYAVEPFLTPEKLPEHSAKFTTVIKSIQEGEGVVLVYSNFVQNGALLFALALEEHGFVPAVGTPKLASPSYTGTPKGKYIMLTSAATDAEISTMLSRVKSPKNRDGKEIKVILSSPIAAEGIDFRYIRQVHILDPWWNMSRIEQVIGRGLRTCSHQLLPFEKQNCSVYLHVVRTGDGKECFDEYTYRTRVEPKAIKIAKVRRVMAQSAMDCPLQNKVVNTLPEDWKNLEITQTPSEGSPKTYRLYGMMAPSFDDGSDITECIVPKDKEDKDHIRPLSTYLDVRDEILQKVAMLFIDKAIWDRDQLLNALKPFTTEVVIYNLQHAISTGYRFKDAFNRPSVLESKGDLYALSPIGIPNGTFLERTTLPPVKGSVALPTAEVEEEEIEIAPDLLITKRNAIKWPADALTRFTEKNLNGYTFDHEFKENEKRAYLKTKPDTLPFSDRLYLPGSDYIILGHETYEPPEPPVGDDNTRFKEWNASLLAKFIANKDMLFSSVNPGGKFTVSKMKIDGDKVKRFYEKSSKRFEPIACGTGDNTKPIMLAFAKYIDKRGVGVPESLKTLPEICMYIELLAREEHNCFWVSPEELSVLYDNKTNKDAFTKVFKS